MSLEVMCLFFFLILSNYVLSRTLFVLFTATMSIARREKCLLGQLASSGCGIKDASFLELSVFNLPKNENCQGAKIVGDEWMTSLQPGT